MAKVTKKPKSDLGIKDQKVLKFLLDMGIEYGLSRKLSDGSYVFEFDYLNRHFVFNVDVYFIKFITEFSRKFYESGYSDSIERISMEVYDMSERKEQFIKEDF